MKLSPYPNPRDLIFRWQSGEIEREEMQLMMAAHHQVLLEEADEYHQNPIAGYLEGLMNKRMAKRLVSDHGEAAVRELFLVMSCMPDFSPSAYLWNADHWDVELHAFIRTKSEPVFRVRESLVKSTRAVLLVEHGSAKRKEMVRERMTFKRNWKGEMEMVAREKLR